MVKLFHFCLPGAPVDNHPPRLSATMMQSFPLRRMQISWLCALLFCVCAGDAFLMGQSISPKGMKIRGRPALCMVSASMYDRIEKKLSQVCICHLVQESGKENIALILAIPCHVPLFAAHVQMRKRHAAFETPATMRLSSSLC
jgi:hypothetical protein